MQFARLLAISILSLVYVVAITDAHAAESTQKVWIEIPSYEVGSEEWEVMMALEEVPYVCTPIIIIIGLHAECTVSCFGVSSEGVMESTVHRRCNPWVCWLPGGGSDPAAGCQCSTTTVQSVHGGFSVFDGDCGMDSME